MEGVWILAFEYETSEEAYESWDLAKELIERLVGTGHTSTYRLLVIGKPTVVVIGENPPVDGLQETFRQICGDGKEVSLPSEVTEHLLSRRANFDPSKGRVQVRHHYPFNN